MNSYNTTPKPLVVIVGPTASGKSGFGMKVAERFNGEIICADSRTVYKGMDIGTAKPSPKDRRVIRHHLLDIKQPDEPFNAADFKQLANQAIQDISRRGKLPIMVGGSGLYIDAVIFDYRFGSKADAKKRRKLNGLSVEELQKICSDSNISIPVNSQNKRHLIRTIEMNGLLQQKMKIRKGTIIVGITTERSILRQRITKRAIEMIKAGVVEEIRKLSRYDPNLEAMKGNIYRIFLQVIQGKKSIQEAKEEFITSDMRLAKRQMTWFKRNPHIYWGQPPQLMRHIEQFLLRHKTLIQ